jgi:hypothetical protein
MQNKIYKKEEGYYRILTVFIKYRNTGLGRKGREQDPLN